MERKSWEVAIVLVVGGVLAFIGATVQSIRSDEMRQELWGKQQTATMISTPLTGTPRGVILGK